MRGAQRGDADRRATGRRHVGYFTGSTQRLPVCTWRSNTSRPPRGDQLG
jgi:hypothetical protein